MIFSSTALCHLLRYSLKFVFIKVCITNNNNKQPVIYIYIYIYTNIYTPDISTNSILYEDSVSRMTFSLFLYHYTNYFTHLRCIVIYTCRSIIIMVIDNFSSYNLLTLLSNFNFAFCVLILIYMYSLILIFILF